jgi:transposase
VGERTRIINRMKAALARLGIRGFKPELRRASQRLEALRTAEDRPIPPNTLAEIRRDLARLATVREQIDGPWPSGWCRSAGPQLGSEPAPAATAGS